MAKREHHYRTCRDPECERLPCVAYREGYDDGVADAMAAASDG